MRQTIQDGIQSARLSLSLITDTELSLYQRLYGDSATMQFIGPCYDQAQSAEFFRRCLKQSKLPESPWYYFAIRLHQQQQQAIGFVSLIPTRYPAAPFELGIMLSAEARGLGYADEALTALFLHCFTILELPALLARVNPENKGATKHIQHFGFVQAPTDIPEQQGLQNYLLTASADTRCYLKNLAAGIARLQENQNQAALATTSLSERKTP